MVDPLARMIGNQIIKARERLGWTRQDLIQQADIPNTTLYRYEIGAREEPHVSNLIKIADATGVTVDYLLGRDGVAQRIRRARALKKLTQQGLAGILNVPITTVRRWEAIGDAGVDRTMLPAIAEAIGVPVEYLIGGFFEYSRKEK